MTETGHLHGAPGLVAHDQVGTGLLEAAEFVLGHGRGELRVFDAEGPSKPATLVQPLQRHVFDALQLAQQPLARFRPGDGPVVTTKVIGDPAGRT